MFVSAPALSDARTVAAYSIFVGSYIVFAIGKFPGLKIDRPGAAIIGAVATLAIRLVTPSEAIRDIDFATIVLLFSMMLIVGNLHQAGFFEWNAELVLRRLKPAHLLPAVVLTSGVLSAFFVNDIVCLVMVPLVLTVTRKIELPPAPYLIAVATSSNIGSVATITGNPQNMLIGSYSGIDYRTFLFRLGPVAALGLLINCAILQWMHRGLLASESSSQAEKIPLPALELRRVIKPAIVGTAVVLGFFSGVTPALMAALGAAAVLISRSRNPRHLYQEVDWGLLVFFVGLFVIVGGAQNAGIVSHLIAFASRWGLHNSAVFATSTVVLSNFVSNVPAVMLLKAVVPGFRDPRTAWLLLAMASTLAGNLAITGSVANIIVVETAKPDIEIGFWTYSRVGIPITLATLAVGWAWLTFVP